MAVNTTSLKNPNIALSTKFILTEGGIDYCVKSKIPIRDLITWDRRKVVGFHWNTFKAQIIQKLITNGFFKEIDINRTELLTKRTEIIDLTKLIVYSILYKKFKPTLNSILYESEIINLLYKSNTKMRISPDLKFNSGVVKKFIFENEKAVRSLKASLLFEPYAMISDDSSIEPEQKEIKKKIAKKFIDMVDDNTWFLFHFVNKSNDKFEIMAHISNTIISFVKKTTIADYIAFMIMELIQNAEKAHFKNLAIKDNIARGDGVDLDELLKDKAFRQKLKQRAEKNHNYINIHYKFDTEKITSSSRLQLQLSVANNGCIGEKIRRKLLEKATTNVKEKSLAEFYKESDPKKLGANLGLYYLSYLQKACSDENIVFDARIISDEKRDQTIAMMLVHI